MVFARGLKPGAEEEFLKEEGLRKEKRFQSKSK